MEIHETSLGTVRIAERDVLNAYFADEITAMVDALPYPPGIGLTGGSTPKAWYQWLVENRSDFKEVVAKAIWSVSDERHVPHESEESNFGNAIRMLLDPMEAHEEARFPWDTGRDPADAAQWYEYLWGHSFGEGKAYDMCILGMGDDCHTASIFPGSPLLEQDLDSGSLFTSVEVPGKGMRLTITPYGLTKCDRIVAFITGAGKAEALQKVFADTPIDYSETPIRLLGRSKEKVIWLLDEAAAGKLSF